LKNKQDKQLIANAILWLQINQATLSVYDMARSKTSFKINRTGVLPK